jgi:Protein of unknown function (DUF3237)
MRGQRTVDELRYEFLYDIGFDLEPALEVGPTPHERRIVYITGGKFNGPRLKGRVLPGGGDWLVVRPDGRAVLDVRACLETDDGAIIYTYYAGRLVVPSELLPLWRDRDAAATIDPTRYYLRITPVYETAAEKYRWLNDIVAVGVGRRTAAGVAYRVFEIK